MRYLALISLILVLPSYVGFGAFANEDKTNEWSVVKQCSNWAAVVDRGLYNQRGHELTKFQLVVRDQGIILELLKTELLLAKAVNANRELIINLSPSGNPFDLYPALLHGHLLLDEGFSPKILWVSIFEENNALSVYLSESKYPNPHNPSSDEKVYELNNCTGYLR